MEQSFLHLIFLVAAVLVVALACFWLPFMPALWRWIKTRFFAWLFKGAAFFFILIGITTTGAWIYAQSQPLTFETLRTDGERILQSGYGMLPRQPDLYHTVTLPPARLHIVGSRQQFMWEYARDPVNRIMGYCNIWPNDKHWNIYVLGTQVNNKIIFNPETLGHEILHMLQSAQPQLYVNPDKMHLLLAD